MNDGVPVWMVLVALIIVGTRVASWVRFKSEKSKADAQAATMRETLAARDGPTATVSAYRVPNFVGKLNLYYVNCDDAPVAGLKNGRYATFTMPAGTHVFSIPGVAAAAPITATLESGQHFYIRCGFQSVTKFVFEPVPEATARSEIARLAPAD